MRTQYDRDIETALNRGIDDGRRAVRQISDRAGDVARQSADWLRDSGDQVRTQLTRASQRSVDYVRDEPVRSVLMAAAVVTVLFAAVHLLRGRRNR